MVQVDCGDRMVAVVNVVMVMVTVIVMVIVIVIVKRRDVKEGRKSSP